MNFDPARKIADAVLYEGYVLYPYRASAQKNRLRWQFGVLAPRAWSEAGGCEHWWRRTECLIECAGGATLHGKLRFLQVATRRIETAADGQFRAVSSVEIGGRLYTSWEEGVEREVDFSLALTAENGAALDVPFEFPSGMDVEKIGPDARILREQIAIRGLIRIAAEPLDIGRIKLRVREENLTAWTAADAPRSEVLSGCFVGAHMLLGIEGGAFISLTDPPQSAAAAARACRNVRTWPVMAGAAGQRDLVLSSPIILQDYPQVAPESPADLFDAAEIDEILILRTMTLTEDEKREARATDPRAAELISRIDATTPETMARLHGTIRNLRREETAASEDTVEVEGVAVSRGSRVRLRPRLEGADAQDMFLHGRIGEVCGIFRDLEDKTYLAVTLEDDPAAELYWWHGRFLYFRPDEVSPLLGSSVKRTSE